MFKYLLKKYSINIEVLSLALCIIFVYKIVTLSLKKLELQSSKNGKWSLSLLFHALQTPFKTSFSLWIIVLTAEFSNSHFRFVKKFSTIAIQQSILVLFVAWAIIHFFNLVRNHAAKNHESNLDRTSIMAFTQIGTVIVVIIATLVELQIIGVHIAGLLAFGGLSGIAVGFASKDLLANFFGAMMIYLDKPFKVGDWILSPEKDIEGEVEEIGWRQTKIITFEKRPIYVPNSVFSTVIVENPSRMTHRKIEEKILIKHEDHQKVKEIAQEIREFLANHHEIDNSQNLFVHLNTISPLALEIRIYCYTTVVTSALFAKLKEEVLLQSATIIQKYEAHFVETILQEQPQTKHNNH